MIPRVKICCINSPEEAQTVILAGASAIGLVGKMPSGPGVITDDLIHRIAQSVPPPIGTFLLTCETSVKEIIKHHNRTQTNTIQLVDALVTGTYEELRIALRGVKLVQVIHVTDESSINQAIAVSDFVDAVLLDSGNPNLQIKELGGTGRTHNWDISRIIRDSIKIPVFLAGGLNPENVKQAIEIVNPFGIDVCSGVRSNGALDKEKLDKFINEVYKSF